MKKKVIAYMVRHGQHKDNILTVVGMAQIVQATQAIAMDMIAHKAPNPKQLKVVFSSEEPRAVQSSAIGAGMLGIKVIGGPDVRFNTANGLADALKAGDKLPKFGEGACKAWIDKGCEGVELAMDVATRARSSIYSNCVDGTIGVIYCHGGVVEPTIHGMENADDHDMAEGEVAVIEQGEDGQKYVRYLNND